MSEFRHYHCEARRQDAAATGAAIPGQAIRNKHNTKALLLDRSGESSVPIEQGKMEGHNRN